MNYSKILRTALSITCAAIAVSDFRVPASAQSKEEMVNALRSKAVRTRSISRGHNISQLKRLTDPARLSRGVKVEERKKIYSLTKSEKLPSLNLEIYFEYNSASISPQSYAKLATLADAITAPDFINSKFFVFGHADARGSNQYNLKLSHRRAEAVKQFLAAYGKMGSDKFVAIGYGEEQLKNPHNPEAAENRRVQIINFQGN